MLYYLFEYLDKTMDIPGAGVFQYITFSFGIGVNSVPDDFHYLRKKNHHFPKKPTSG